MSAIFSRHHLRLIELQLLDAALQINVRYKVDQSEELRGVANILLQALSGKIVSDSLFVCKFMCGGSVS